MKNMSIVQPPVSTAQGFIKCDICPARAVHETTFASGPLYFCNHHFVENQEALQAIAINSIQLSQEA